MGARTSRAHARCHACPAPPVRVPLTVEKETPDACGPCDGAHHCHSHSASPALDPVREHVRNALKATVFYKKQINPLRAIMGYN